MRLLHTSDWHIGRQLHGVSLIEDQRYVLDQIVTIADVEAVDAVIIAGDLYDRAIPPADAVSLMGETLRRLCQDLKKPVLVIAGNHDSGERLGFAAELLGSSGLHIVGQLAQSIDPITVEANGESIDLFGLPYAGPLTVRDALGVEVSSHEQAMRALLERVQSKRTAGRPTVLVAHCFVAGTQESDSERPLSVGGADQIPAGLFASFNYTALGHLHRPQFVGDGRTRYSGSILKYSFSEAEHEKSVTLIDIDPSGLAHTQLVPLHALRDLRVVEGTLDDVLKQGRTDPKADDYILARLVDTGALLDVMGKLRSVYPNVMQMQNIGVREGGPSPDASREMLEKSHLDLFEAFFEEIQEEPVSDEQRQYMVSLLESIGTEDTK